MTSVENLTTAEKWDYIFRFFGISDFVNFISSAQLQSALLPIKIVFIFFGFFFLAAVIYFYINSSYIQYQFLQDTVEFLSWQSYGLRQINKRWQKIVKRIEAGNKTESEYKLAIIQADDLLYSLLEERGYQGEDFNQLLNSARKKILPSFEEIDSAHKIRNSLVYDLDYRLDLELAKRILDNYEKAIKNI